MSARARFSFSNSIWIEVGAASCRVPSQENATQPLSELSVEGRYIILHATQPLSFSAETILLGSNLKVLLTKNFFFIRRHGPPIDSTV